MKHPGPSRRGEASFTLAEVLIAVAIFVIAVFAILELVAQNMQLVKFIQQQRPDLGALAGKTMMELPPPDGELATGLLGPPDEDFGGNGGGPLALYPNSRWDRNLEAIDATNGLYRATLTVIQVNNDGQETEFTLNFLLYRPDLAESELSGGTQ
jgi:hypothetical protein